jgi:hypothetical protein
MELPARVLAPWLGAIHVGDYIYADEARQVRAI